MLILSPRSHRQPAQPTSAALQNPLARGLLRLYDFSAIGNNVDVIKHSKIVSQIGGRTTYRGRIGKRLVNGAGGDNLVLEDSLRTSLSTQVTWFLVANFSTTSSGFLLGNVQSSGAGYNHGLYSNANGFPTFFVKTAGVGTSCAGTTVLAGRGLSRLVGTYDGTTMRVYLDGAQEGSAAKTGTLDSTDFDICLNVWNGVSTTSGQAFMGGVASRAWSAGEVKHFSRDPWQLFQQGRRLRMPSLVAAPPPVGTLGQWHPELRLQAWF